MKKCESKDIIFWKTKSSLANLGRVYYILLPVCFGYAARSLQVVFIRRLDSCAQILHMDSWSFLIFCWSIYSVNSTTQQ